MATFVPPYDYYRSKGQPDERMATDVGVGLPAHVDPNDWDLMTLSETSPELFVEYVHEDVAERGFCYFKLVDFAAAGLIGQIERIGRDNVESVIRDSPRFRESPLFGDYPRLIAQPHPNKLRDLVFAHFSRLHQVALSLLAGSPALRDLWGR